MKYVLLYLSIYLLTSCSSNTVDRIAPVNLNEQTQIEAASIPISHSSTPSSLKNKQQEISKLIGLDCENSSQCKIIGVGVSACGGFSSYSVYSEKSTDIDRLKESVNQFNQIMRAQNRKNKIVGICRHIEAPKTQCQLNRCSVLNNNLSL